MDAQLTKVSMLSPKVVEDALASRAPTQRPTQLPMIFMESRTIKSLE